MFHSLSLAENRLLKFRIGILIGIFILHLGGFIISLIKLLGGVNLRIISSILDEIVELLVE